MLFVATLDCEVGLSHGLPPSQEEGGEGEVVVHRLREELTHLKDLNKTLYSVLAEKTKCDITN